MVVFAIQDLIKDPPFTRLDLLSCRNLLIYLEPELQRPSHLDLPLRASPRRRPLPVALGERRHDPGLFRPIDRKWKLFRPWVPSHVPVPPRAGQPARRDRARRAFGRRGAHEEGPKGQPRRAREPGSRGVLRPAGGGDRPGRQHPLRARGHGEIPAPRAGARHVERDRAGPVPASGGAPGRLPRSGLRRPLRPLAREATTKVGGKLETVLLSVKPIESVDGGHGLLLVSFQERPPAPPLRASPGKGVRPLEEPAPELRAGSGPSPTPRSSCGPPSRSSKPRPRSRSR